MRFSAHSPFYPLPLVLLLTGFLFLCASSFFSQHLAAIQRTVGLAILIALVLSTLLSFIPSRMVLGADGIERRWLWFRRYIPFSSVRQFRVRAWIHPRFILHSGEIVRLPLPVDNDLPRKRLPRSRFSRTLFAIGEAFDRAKETEIARTEGLAELLGPRRGESTAKWRERLSAERSGYRSQAIRDRDLWNAVSDPLAGAPVRIGAALVLAQTMNEEERSRIATIAATTARPNLRVALEQAADPSLDDAELDAIVERLKEET